jgi:predicted P-loop ATPase
MAQKKDTCNDLSATEMLKIIEDLKGVTYRYNTRLECKEIVAPDGMVTRFEDCHMADIWNSVRAETLLKETYSVFKNKTEVVSTLDALKILRPFDPIMTYLNNCLYKYNQTPGDYFVEVFQKLQLADEMQERMFRKWLIGCIARVTHSFQNNAFILGGLQGSGKSTFFRSLLKNLSLNFSEQAVDLKFQKKESILSLGRFLIWHIEEISGYFKNYDRDQFKAFMTLETIDQRKSWGKENITPKRVCSFAGSTNDQSFLTDPTGNRRYICTWANAIDLDWFRDVFSPDLLWGQAFSVLCEHGVSACLFDADESAYQSETNDNAMVNDGIEDAMRDWFIFGQGGYVRLKDVLSMMSAHDVGKSSSRHHRLVEIMTKWGCCKKIRNGYTVFADLKGNPLTFFEAKDKMPHLHSAIEAD